MEPLYRRLSLALSIKLLAVVFAVICVGVICVGCGGRDPGTTFAEDVLVLRPITWSSQTAMLGRIAAVADSQDDVAVFGSQGASVWNGGIQVGSDESVVSWRTAAVVPALELPESWLIGVDQLGQVYRMRNRILLEDVTARLGLAGRPVLEVAALNSKLTAYALKDKVAVVDGSAVSFYQMRARGLAGAAGRLAAFDYSNVLEIDFNDPQGARIVQLPLEEAVGVAFDVTGELTLVAATEQALFVEKSGELVKVWDVPDGSKITGIAGSGRGVWVAIGKELALFHGMQLQHGPPEILSEGTHLIGSPSGDVWVLGGPQLIRLGERAPGGSDEDRWRRSILPIFQRICRGCHLPGGSAGTDLSNYAAWSMRRAVIRQRLIDQLPSPMPPTTAGTLTEEELASVRLWTAAAPSEN